MVEDKTLDPEKRKRAAFTLGEIGGPARSAGPSIGRPMVETIPITSNPTNRFLGYEYVLAHTGGTPPEAVPELERITREGKPYHRALASVALWHAEPANQRFREMVTKLLRAPLQTAHEQDADLWAGQVVFALAGHRTNAIVFETEIRALAESAPQPAKSLARRALDQIRSPRALSGQ
jgi:hypothetical protein